MTWIIGASSKFRYGILVSDIQVTYRNGLTKDILQKVYHVGNHVAAGFAGSVYIGFELINDLQLFPPPGYENYFVNPYEIAEKWPDRARKIYNSARKEEQEGQAAILMVAAYPTEQETIFGDSKICIIEFSSPDFDPKIKENINNISSIGSGSDVKEYMKEIERLSNGTVNPMLDSAWEAKIRFEGTDAQGFARCLFLQIDKYPKKGISKNLHVTTIKTGEIIIENNDMRISYPNQKVVELKMPPLARSYAELQSMARSMGVNEIGAIC